MPANRIEELIHEATEAKCKFRLSPPALREFANTLLTEYADSVTAIVEREFAGDEWRLKIARDMTSAILKSELHKFTSTKKA